MTLASRLSASSLAVLAAVMAGFSAALYASAAVHLDRLVDDRIGATLATLVALAEDEPGGLDWEADPRRALPGREPGPDQVRWSVVAGDGEPLDRSANGEDDDPLDRPARRALDRRGRPWRVEARVIRSARVRTEGQDPGRSSSLVLTAGLRLDPSETTLRTLGLALLATASTLWALTALAARGVCRRALAPLSRMAAAARDLEGDEPGRRLPVAPTGDELEDLAHAFNALLGRRDEALERQRRFSGDASHQLRTPLAALIGQVDVALRRDRTPEEYRRVLALARDQSDRLRRLVESLLFLARADAEAGQPPAEPFDLVAWVSEQLDRRSTLGIEGAPRWRGGRDTPIPVLAHPELMAQVLANLLDNARDHAGPGAEVEVEVRAGDEPGFAALEVVDRGRGIDPVDLARVFEPFYRGSAPGRPGSGLGLAVARRIAEAAGGSIEARPGPGRGVRFVVRVPRATGPSGPVDRLKSADPGIR